MLGWANLEELAIPYGRPKKEQEHRGPAFLLRAHSVHGDIELWPHPMRGVLTLKPLRTAVRLCPSNESYMKWDPPLRAASAPAHPCSILAKQRD